MPKKKTTLTIGCSAPDRHDRNAFGYDAASSSGGGASWHSVALLQSSHANRESHVDNHHMIRNGAFFNHAAVD